MLRLGPRVILPYPSPAKDPSQGSVISPLIAILPMYLQLDHCYH